MRGLVIYKVFETFVTIQGLERLIVRKCISGKVAEQVTKIALEKLKNPNPKYALPGLQLLLTCMYMGKSSVTSYTTQRN